MPLEAQAVLFFSVLSLVWLVKESLNLRREGLRPSKWVLVAMLVGILLRTFLAKTPHSYDGVLYIHRIASFSYLNWNPTQFIWTPGLYILARPLDLVAGAWFAGSIITFLSSILTPYLAYLFAKTRWGETQGIAASFVLALMPVAIKFAKGPNTDVLSFAFMLLSLVLFERDSGAAWPALAFFTTIRPENWIFTTLTWLFYRDKSDELILLFLVMLVSTYAFHFGMSFNRDINWDRTAKEPLNNLKTHLPRNTQTFFNIRFFPLLLTPLAVYYARENTDIALLILISLVLYSTYKSWDAPYIGDAKRFSLVPASLIGLLASQFFDSSKKLSLLTIFLITLPATAEPLTHENAIPWLIKTSSEEIREKSLEGTIVSDLSPVFKSIFRGRKVFDTYASPKGKVIILERLVLTPPTQINHYRSYCNFTANWTYEYESREALRIYSAVCPKST